MYYYSCCSSAEAEADIVGLRDGARKGFKDAGQARAYIAAYNYLRSLRLIRVKERELQEVRSGLSNALSHLMVGNRLVKTNTPLPADYTIKVTPIRNALFVPTPRRLTAVVNGHLVEIDFVRVRLYPLYTTSLTFSRLAWRHRSIRRPFTPSVWGPMLVASNSPLMRIV